MVVIKLAMAHIEGALCVLRRKNPESAGPSHLQGSYELHKRETCNKMCNKMHTATSLLNVVCIAHQQMAWACTFRIFSPQHTKVCMNKE